MEWMILPLKRYADFQGRSRRKEYWMFSLLVWIVYATLALILFTTIGADLMAVGGNFGSAESLERLLPKVLPLLSILGLVWLALLIPSLAVGVRRMHDTERTGWWAVTPTLLSVVGTVLASAGIGFIFSLASFVVGIIVFVFSVLEGTRGPNRFGPDPKDPDGDLESVFS